MDKIIGVLLLIAALLTLYFAYFDAAKVYVG
ncbi:hypothetical protein AFAEC_0238 [Aliarcobacter faecis]|nr:hypothetical protein AFAEC_0238 [Aliarcobacter faecis]